MDEYLRVTNILYPFSGLDKVDKDLVAYAADRGSRVHKVCEAIVKGLDELGVDKEIQPYIDSFKQWWGEGKEVIAIEKRFYCDKYRFTGQMDLIIREDNNIIIIDYKTSSRPSKTWEAQGGAYAYLAQQAGHDVKEVHFLHLSKLGKAPKVHKYPADSTFFFHCYHVYKHFYHKE